MARKKKLTMEFRYYQLPYGSPVLALLGEKWKKQYGDHSGQLHFHNYLEVGFCYYGSGYMLLGEERIGFGDRMFTVIPANYPHTTNSDIGTECQWEYLFIDVKSVFRALNLNPVRIEKMKERVNSRALILKEEENPELVGVLLKAFEVMRKEEEYYLEEVQGLLTAFLTGIARLNKSEQEAEKTGDINMPDVISRSLDYIAEHYLENIRIEAIAKYCHISETHFRRMFAEHMRMSPMEYINFVRVRTACEYLKTTDLPISEIVHKCGFSTDSTFNRNFKLIMGTTPVKWRQRPENYEHRLLDFDIHLEEGW